LALNIIVSIKIMFDNSKFIVILEMTILARFYIFIITFLKATGGSGPRLPGFVILNSFQDLLNGQQGIDAETSSA